MASGPGACPLPSNLDNFNPNEMFQIDTSDVEVKRGCFYCHEAGSTFLIFFLYGIVLFSLGYTAGRLGLGIRLSPFVRVISPKSFGGSVASRISRFRKFASIGLFTCILTFVAVIFFLSSSYASSSAIGRTVNSGLNA